MFRNPIFTLRPLFWEVVFFSWAFFPRSKGLLKKIVQNGLLLKKFWKTKYRVKFRINLRTFCHHEIFRNSGNSKWNFSGIGHILSNLTVWDTFPTQYLSLSSIFHSEYVNSNYLGIPVKLRNSWWNFEKLTKCMKWGVNSTWFEALSSNLLPMLSFSHKWRNLE